LKFRQNKLSLMGCYSSKGRLQ